MADFNLIPTTTLNISPFDVLKTTGVEDPLININKLASMDFEESYLEKSIQFANLMNEEFTNNKLVLYTCLSESASEEVMLESFDSFFSGVKDIIDKFLKFIKSLFERFLVAVNKLISSDKYIKKHKDDFKFFKSADNFEYEGYKFTFDENIPCSSAIRSYNQDLFKDVTGAVDGKITLATLQNAIASTDHTIEYDNFRAEVIGKGGSISAEDFSEELFKVFRDGEMNTSTIDVDYSVVKMSLDRFLNYKKTKEKIERQRTQVEKDYEAVKKSVSDLAKRNSDLDAKAFNNQLPSSVSIDTSTGNVTNVVMPSEFMLKMDVYVKNKTDMIQEFSNIHCIAFGAELDAMKLCLAQDKNILYTALSKIKRTDNARRDDK